MIAPYMRVNSVFAKRIGRYREGIGNTVARVLVRQFCHRFKRGERAVLISAVHRVSAGREGLSRPSAVGRVARLFAVYHVGSYGKHAHRRYGIAVGRVALNLGHKGLYIER